MWTKPVKRVGIIGGGLGGLALAHYLAQTHYKVIVFERDSTPVSRSQGYYIGINEDGYRVLEHIFHHVPGLKDLMNLGSKRFCFHLVDNQLNELMTISSGTSYLVNRWLLRECLSQNLNIEWNKKFVKYEEKEEVVTVYFEDGSNVEVDLLVGSDGANSMVRVQRCPSVQYLDIGVTDIGGTVPYSEEFKVLIKYLNTGFMRVGGNNGHSMLLFIFENRMTGNKDILWSMSWNTEQVDRDDYQKIKSGIYNESEINERVVKKVINYFSHPELIALVQRTAADKQLKLKLGPKKSSMPRKDSPLGKTTRVTMLGDAIHPMTTQAGLGANTALMDAFKLYEALKSDSYEGLVKYETDLVKRGHYSVNVSLAMTRRIHQKGITATVAKWIIWIVGRVMKNPKFFAFMVVIFIVLLFLWKRGLLI